MCQSCDDALNIHQPRHIPYTYECSCCRKMVEVEYAWRAYNIYADFGSAIMRDPQTGELKGVEAVCFDCYDKYHKSTEPAHCPSCNGVYGLTNLSGLSGPIANGKDIACQRCVIRHTFRCDHCDERMSRQVNNIYSTSFGGIICGGCYEDEFFTCDRCDNIHHNDDQFFDADRHQYICQTCQNQEPKLIKDYNFKPAPHFFGLKEGSDRQKKIFYGCELEVYVKSDYDIDEKAKEVASYLNKNDERVYFKKDSSIGRGFEIVTHPHTWEEVTKLWLENWDEKIRGISSHNSGTCGFHVHVSRRPLTDMHIQKMVQFVNDADNESLIKTVAQRTCDEYGRLNAAKKVGKCRYSEHRYEAINLLNHNTIEFRIFRGNLRKERIMKNLEFVKATIDFTRDRSYRDLTTPSFLKFISGNRKHYKHLHDYLNNVHFYPNPQYAGDASSDR